MTWNASREPGRRTALRVTSAVALACCGLLLTACSGTSTGSAAQVKASPSASAGRAQQQAAYRDCLTQHGVTPPARPSGAPRGGNGGGGFGGGLGGPGGAFGDGASPNPALQQALQACASLRPRFNGGGPGGGPGGTAFRAYTSCLRDHGVTLPSASPGGRPLAMNTADPKIAQAFQVCRPLLPQRGGPAGPGSAMPSATPSAAASA